MNLLKTGRPTNKQKAIQKVQEIAEATIRMNINIPRDFHKQIKQKALDENITVTELVSKAVKAYISK
jgi:predicted HicB family RNase H-like nuclease